MFVIVILYKSRTTFKVKLSLWSLNSQLFVNGNFKQDFFICNPEERNIDGQVEWIDNFMLNSDKTSRK